MVGAATLVVAAPPILVSQGGGGPKGVIHGGSLRPVRGAPHRSVWDDVKRGARGLNTALTATAKQLHLKVGDLPFTVAGLADHMPIHYATHLWNSLLASRQGVE
jgi:triacylglycerol lipase